MKIAGKMMFVAALAFAGQVYAADTPMPPLVDAAGSAAPVAAPAAAPEPHASAADTLPPAVAVAEETASASHAPETPEGKVPQSVKDVIKHLNNVGSDMTLDDLNAARQAVAKLDALIDIEKRLSDLDKLRHEREDKSVASAIPASALMPPPGGMMRFPQAQVSSAAPAPMMLSSIEVSRIEGGDGRYAAVLKNASTTSPVRAGDHLPDGSEVVAITAQGVVLRKNGVDRVLRVKDVDTVASGMMP